MPPSEAERTAMPSQLHEALLQLFRYRPALAPELLGEALHVELPAYSEVRIESADLTDLNPAAHRADLVVLLSRRAPVLGIVVEVQLGRDPDKRYAWPVYVANLRARLRCPVELLVVAPREPVARWARQAIDLGGGNRFRPWVLGPAAVPVVADAERARQDPELAVLSAMAHGRDREVERAVRVAASAMAASRDLDADRAALYFDLIEVSLSAAARKVLRSMEPANYEFQSAFARRYFRKGQAEGEARGKAEGKAEGMAEVVVKLLERRFGRLPAEGNARVRAATTSQLDAVVDGLLTAASLEELLARLAPAAE